jgi:hypothetical protein
MHRRVCSHTNRNHRAAANEHAAADQYPAADRDLNAFANTDQYPGT